MEIQKRQDGFSSDSANVKRLKLALINEAKDSDEPCEESGLHDEIERYLTMKNDEDSALAFWQNREKSLPLLSSMARVYLCLSPGSVPVESLFSTTGLILNSKRSCLDPNRCNFITFVHDNAKFVKPMDQ